MNIDDRLEALAQSVQLLASLHKDNERMLGRLEKQIEKLAQVNERKGKQIDRLEGLVTEIAEGTARLLHVAEAHEQRISDLERRSLQQ